MNVPLSIPNIDKEDIEAVTRTLADGWVSTVGKYVDEFEKDLSIYLKAEHVLATQSGTSAMHLALRSIDIGPEAGVIVPVLSFIATVNPVRYCNAEPIFIDCDDYLQIDVQAIYNFIKNDCDVKGRKIYIRGTHIKAIIVTHIFGDAVDMEQLMDLKKDYDLWIIEDACEAIGSVYTKGTYAGKSLGTIGDIGVYSFNGNKIITTGNGGALTVKKTEVYNRAKYLAGQAKDDALFYIHNDIGYNYRMASMQAALGLSQLGKLPQFVKRKKEIFIYYSERINRIKGLRILEVSGRADSNHWFVAMYIEDEFGMSRNQIMDNLKKRGIESRPLWGLLNEQKPYNSCEKYKIIKAYSYYDKVLNIPCSTNIRDFEMDYICNCLEEMR